jgi:TBC1 domain family member 5
MNKKLGKSVGWIVDVLLQDESEANPQDLARIHLRKREALESLSYVRDVLLGDTSEVDDTRLVGEEELKARRSREEATRHPEPPRTILPPPASVPVAESRSRPTSLSAFPYAVDATRSSRSYPPRRPSSSSPSPPPGSKQSSNPTRLAPWNHTKSNFTGENVLVPTLPRFPPPVSVHNPVTTPPSEVSRRKADDHPPQDPLGVLK